MLPKKLLLLIILFCYASLPGAEQYSGIVVRSGTSDPIENATVSVGHTQVRTRTDSEGRFSLNISTGIFDFSKKPKSKKILWNNRSGLLDLRDASSIKRISIFDLNGRSVFQSDVSSKNRLIKVSLVARGIYFLRLIAENGAAYSSKINTSGSATVFAFNYSHSSHRVAADAVPVKVLFRHDDYYPVDRDILPGQEIQISMEKDPRSFIFDQHEVHSYHFTMSVDDSLHMERYAQEENYVPAEFKLNANTFGKVGIRYKGSSYSLPNCFDEEGNRFDKPECEKISFKIKFNKYVDSLRLYKMKAIYLHSMSADGSKMHDMLAYQMFREMGIYSPRVSYAKVYINGVFQGLYAAIEAIDGRFTKARWPEYGDGNLYKEAWPSSINTNYYKNSLQTNEDPEDSADVSAMVNLCRTIKSATAQTFTNDVTPHLDLNYLVRYFAVDRAIKNWDGITGWYTNGGWKGNHNFFIYEEETVEGKIWLIPWDLDNTFSKKDPYIEDADVPNWNVKSEACAPIDVWGGTSQVIPSNCDKLTSMIAEVCWNDFVKVGEELLNSGFDVSTINAKIDKYTNLIDTIIQNDPRVEYGLWETEISSLKRNISSLHTDFYNHIHQIEEVLDTSDYSEPFTGSGELVLDHTNNFEYAPLEDGSFPFSYLYKDDSATVSLIHSTENPVWGSADLLFSFLYKRIDDTLDYSEWSGLGLSIEKTDISSCKEIRVSLSTDKQRYMWVHLNSPIYENHGVEEHYGWAIYVNSTPKIYQFSIDDINYPTWADPKNPSLIDSVLNTFTGICFDPSGVFDSQGELMSSTDEGFLRIDNVKFVF